MYNFILFLVSILILTHGEVYSAENQHPVERVATEGMTYSCEPEDYVDIIPAELPIFKKKDPDIFNLTQYYDDLEPPDQGGMLGRYAILGEDALYFLGPALLVLGGIYMLPEDVSNWEKDDINWEHGSEKWPENVTSWQWDEDDDWINYIGHPYFGSAYYVYARHYGYSRLESLCFSFTASAFYEIGLEAWAEPVSIQDMIFTPLLGWGLAELLLPLEHTIKMNDKKVLNSRILGAVSLFLIDPLGHIVIPFKNFTQSFFSEDAEVSLSPIISYPNLAIGPNKSMKAEEQFGLVLTVQW